MAEHPVARGAISILNVHAQGQHHPDWSFYGKDFPTKRELLAQRNRRLQRYPNTSKRVDEYFFGFAANRLAQI